MFDLARDNPMPSTALVIGPVAMFIIGLIAAPLIAARIPADYFAHERRPPTMRTRQPLAVYLALRIGKNLLGLVLVLAGIAMLVLPGQGLLTLFVGVLLLDLPGKYRLERWLVRKPWVHRPINWLRSKRGRSPLELGDPPVS